ncbi:hypothetical protein PBI_PAT3_42 [Mycobacterium phage Pat3]|nr:hypothetical protein PBI_PAT3_42 [Mycobacterium phage Pat3]
MNEELRAVLAEAQALHRWRGDFLGCGCGWNWPEVRTFFCGEDKRIARAYAAHVVDALLSLPGVAVIQLPEPEVWDGPGKERYWRIGDTTVTVDKWNMLSVTLNDDWSGDETPPSAADFRDLAAALLAAAAAVVAEGEDK